MLPSQNFLNKSHHLFFILVLLAAFLARLSISLYASPLEEHGDMARYKQWGYAAFTYGVADAYTGKHINLDNKVINQPPGTLYILTGIYACFTILSFFPLTTMNPSAELHFLLTIPSILADIGMAFLIYLMIDKKKSISAFLGVVLFLFNPAILYNSAFWDKPMH